MPVLEWMLMAGVFLLIGSALINTFRANQQQQRLERAFYRLLESENGIISLIQLAVTAKVDAELAKHYLNVQVKAFNAELEIDADGDTFYRFPKLKPLHGQ